MGTAARRLATARKKRRHATAAMRALRDGRIPLEFVLDHAPPSLHAVSIHSIIVNTPRMGRAGAKKCLEAAEVWPEAKLGELITADLQRIKQHLPPRARKQWPSHKP